MRMILVFSLVATASDTEMSCMTMIFWTHFSRGRMQDRKCNSIAWLVGAIFSDCRLFFGSPFWRSIRFDMNDLISWITCGVVVFSHNLAIYSVSTRLSFTLSRLHTMQFDRVLPCSLSTLSCSSAMAVLTKSANSQCV